jgi:hypothetical protein
VLFKGEINTGKGAHVARMQWQLSKYQIKHREKNCVSGRLSKKRSRNILHNAISCQPHLRPICKEICTILYQRKVEENGLYPMSKFHRCIEFSHPEE